jgi:hypothetical protein
VARSPEPARWMGWRGRVPVLGDPDFPLATAPFHVTNRPITPERFGWASQAVPVGPPLPGVRIEDGIQVCWVKPGSAVGDVLPHLHRYNHAALLIDDHDLQGGSQQDPLDRRHARHKRPGLDTSDGGRADADASGELALAQICHPADASNHPGQHRCERSGHNVAPWRLAVAVARSRRRVAPLVVVRRTHIPRIVATTTRFDRSREPVDDRSPLWISAVVRACAAGATETARAAGSARTSVGTFRLPLLCVPIRNSRRVRVRTGSEPDASR